MKRGAIFYFSGTGNTEMVVQLVKAALNTHDIQTKVYKIDDMSATLSSIQWDTYQYIGFAYPVHALNAPKLVLDFIDQLPEFGTNSNSKFVFTFRTAGDPFAQGGSTKLIRKRLSTKGLKVTQERLFIMPANVMMHFPPSLVKQLYLIAQQKAGDFALEISTQRTNLQKNSLSVTWFSAIFSTMESWGAKWVGKSYGVNKDCDLCGLCVRQCPTQNISISSEDKKVKFAKNCIICMRCIYVCPKRAIHSRGFRFFELKRGYDIRSTIRQLLGDPSIPADFLSSATKGFFKRYAKYAGLIPT